MIDNFKTNNLQKKAIEHLFEIGFTSERTMDEIVDSPYLIVSNSIIEICSSAKEFINNNYPKKTQEQVLKLRPFNEKELIVKMSKKDKLVYKLLSILNNKKNSNITGYDVSWTIQKNKDNSINILPISPFSCGCISKEHLSIMLKFSEDNSLDFSLRYTEWNDEKSKFGTYTPCFHIY
jgi:hypothetical protein